MVKRTITALLAGITATILLAAPVTKEKDEPLAPITERMLKKSENNLRQIGLAIHNFHDVNNKFPSNIVDGKGKSLLSWRVEVLPYLEQGHIYKKLRLNEPWDSEHNKPLLEKVPEIYAPVRGRVKAGETFYQMFAGENGLLRPGKPRSMASVTDGLSNTFMVVEAAKPVHWAKPDDMEFNGKDVPKLGGMFDGRAFVLMCDGSVRRIKKDADMETLRLLIIPNDGNVINTDRAFEDEK